MHLVALLPDLSGDLAVCQSVGPLGYECSWSFWVVHLWQVVVDVA